MLSREPPVLEVRGAVVRYGKVVALAGVDLELAPGEWVALLGPNGAGKTSLLSALAGLVPLASGEARLGGHAVGTEDAQRLLGVVPQELALYSSLTVRENLETAATLYGLSRAETRARVPETLEAVGLADRANDRVSRLSGGMKRRLNVACGVLHHPRVVVLDEPTVGVDPPARARLRSLLEGLRRGGAALLQSTHQLDEVERVVDRVVVLDRGRVVADGTVQRLVEAAAGAVRSVSLVLDAPLDADHVPARFAMDGALLHGQVEDAGAELGALLAGIAASGRRVLDVRVEAPTLADVFARLTVASGP